MVIEPRIDPTGLSDVRYAAFLETVARRRASLHRYCTRMTGSVLDGEDIMQETLFEAYRKLDLLDDPPALHGWLFRIAHNRCVDFIRKRTARQRAETDFVEDDIVLPVEPAGQATGRAIERLVIHLPPKERACVLLKDVFDHSLEEIADLVDSTVGGVKAALKRGRAKLAALPLAPHRVVERDHDPELLKLLERYVELFNCRDWDGVRALTSADAQLRVSDCFRGRLSDSPYFIEYERDQAIWKMVVGEMDGEIVLLVLHFGENGWNPAYPVRIVVADGVINHIADYYACPWIIPAADTVVVSAQA
jgi:RNA polymerase sigma-70 factor (ECF subfamily)